MYFLEKILTEKDSLTDAEMTKLGKQLAQLSDQLSSEAERLKNSDDPTQGKKIINSAIDKMFAVIKDLKKAQ